MSGLGSDAHRALIGEIVEFYKRGDRVRAVSVFGSVAARTWHDLSDIDLDVVIEDDAAVVPEAEVDALLGTRAVIVLVSEDSADCGARFARGDFDPMAPLGVDEPEYLGERPRRRGLLIRCGDQESRGGEPDPPQSGGVARCSRARRNRSVEGTQTR